MPERIVITGGPGSGKTSLINALGDSGYSFLPEVSREVTETAQRAGIDQLFLKDPIQFSQALLEARIEQFHLGQDWKSNYLFYDRGIPDVMAYLDYLGSPYSPHFKELSQSHRYDRILLLPPWPEIYIQDQQRYESFDQSQSIHDHLVKVYKKLGYQSVEIPRGSVDQRVEFVKDLLL
ncbi:AAA family ATPase [Aureitalea marina]|uniref:ATPase n=1 Tax=Aureitalea marina TaxID=930804 RepID=A0A2S7KPN1_9FLAO|nr:ATP-binding protein [Aureitalea marina]PQB04538.1 ATPase [Aureitalea marina]